MRDFYFGSMPLFGNRKGFAIIPVADNYQYFRQGHDVYISLADIYSGAVSGAVDSGSLPDGLSISGAYIIGHLTGSAVTGDVTLSFNGGVATRLVHFDINAANLIAPQAVGKTTIDGTGTVSGGAVSYTLNLGTRDTTNTPVAQAINLFFRGTSPNIDAMVADVGGNAATIELIENATSNQRSCIIYLPPTVFAGSTTTLNLSGITGTVTASNTFIQAYSIINVSADAHPFSVGKDAGTSTIDPVVVLSISDYGFAAVHCAQTSVTTTPANDCTIIGGLTEDFRKTGTTTQGVYRFSGHTTTDEATVPSGSFGIQALLTDGETNVTASNVDCVGFSLRGVDSVQTLPGVLPLTTPAEDMMIGLLAPVIGETYQLDLREGHYGWTDSTVATCVYTVTSGTLPTGLSISGAQIIGIPTGSFSDTAVEITCTRASTSESVAFNLTIPGTVTSTNLATGAPTGPTATPITNGYSLAITSSNQFGTWSMTTVPGITYCARVKVVTGATTGDTQDISIRATGTNTGSVQGYEYDKQFGVINERIVKAGSVTETVELFFRAKTTTTYLQIGRQALYREGSQNPTSQTAPATTSITVTVEGTTCFPIADSIVAGDTSTLNQRWYRDGPIKHVLNRATNWRRSYTGAPIVQNSAGDPIQVLAQTPVGHKGGILRYTITSLHQQNGATLNYGLNRDSDIRAAGQGFREGILKTDCKTEYLASYNSEPHALGIPVIFSAAKAGLVGSLNKAMSYNWMSGSDNQYAIADGSELHVVTTMPEAGRIPFTPSTVLTQKAWLYTDQISDGFVNAYPDPVARPGTYTTLSDHQALLTYLVTQRPTNADGHSPATDAMHFTRHQEYYRRDTQANIASLVATMTLSDMSTSERRTAVEMLIQRGLIDYTWVASGSGFISGGASGLYKIGMMMLALLLDGTEQTALKTALGVALTANEAVTPGTTPITGRWTALPDDSYFSYIPTGMIGQTLTESGTTGRPRAPFPDFALGMPEWRNNDAGAAANHINLNSTGINMKKDGYFGTALLGAAITYTFMRYYPGAYTLWDNSVSFDAVDRFVYWRKIAGTNDTGGNGTWGDDIGPGTLAMFDALRSPSGAPVSAQQWGLTNTGTVVVGSQTAYSVPVMRSWPNGVPTDYDVAGEFASEFPITSRTIGQCYDASMSPISTPAWITNGSGTNITVTTPDTSTLVFVDITGTNTNGSTVARVAIKGS